ncbi:hypothetical protein ASE48_08570 [Mycobacterium sp. Root265]|nr:hypothetical protein ASE48_08570 [Mycobacterium sp. Root265]
MTPRGLAFLKEGVGYVVPGADYWVVEMDALDRLNGPSVHWFPSEVSSLLFAVGERDRAAEHVWHDIHGATHTGVDRAIKVRHPDGTYTNFEKENR